MVNQKNTNTDETGEENRGNQWEGRVSPQPLLGLDKDRKGLLSQNFVIHYV